MDIIPVIDVRHGVAVRAIRGQREGYLPLKTPLAAGSDPIDVARGLRSVFAFPRLYVADLDGIEGRGPNARACRQALRGAARRRILARRGNARAGGSRSVGAWIGCDPSRRLGGPHRTRRRGGAQGGAAGRLRALARLQGRPLRGPAGRSGRARALAAARHRDDACARGERGGPGPRSARRRGHYCGRRGPSMPPAASGTRATLQRWRGRGQRACSSPVRCTQVQLRPAIWRRSPAADVVARGG